MIEVLLFGLLVYSDVMSNGGCGNDVAFRISNGRDSKGQMNFLSVFGGGLSRNAQCVRQPDFIEDLWQFVDSFLRRRKEGGNGLADVFVCGVPVDLFGALFPTNNGTV
ncbi:MAG: hypothetical protein R3E31_28130 [Chloroflexota bacterium]